MEFDHELPNQDLGVRILGLLHVVGLLEEFGDFDGAYEAMNDLRHAAFQLAERVALETDV